MAHAPRFKVYDGSSSTAEYLAAFKHPEDAAVLIASLGSGATIRYGHNRIVWNEGHEDFPASESYDGVAEIVYERARVHDGYLAKARA